MPPAPIAPGKQIEPSLGNAADAALDAVPGERMDAEMPTPHDAVLVVDFGAQYAQLIARRVRECHVYSEIVPHTITAEQIRARAPKAVILSGGPSSVYAEGAPQAAAGFLETG